MNGMKSFVAAAVLIAACGCGGVNDPTDEFFTSGSRAADQRAEQRMAKARQLGGEDEQPAPTRRTLFDRLGGEKGIALIVDDFVARALADPRVNWERNGVTYGGFFRRDRPATWDASDANRARLRKHIAQFLAVATGGPVKYEGRDMRQVHKNLKITNTEFDASIGDLKATLDKFGVGTDEQKELLAIMESARPQVVEER